MDSELEACAELRAGVVPGHRSEQIERRVHLDLDGVCCFVESFIVDQEDQVLDGSEECLKQLQVFQVDK